MTLYFLSWPNQFFCTTWQNRRPGKWKQLLFTWTLYAA